MKQIHQCRCCGSSALFPYLNFGWQPLANSYHKGEETEVFPLAVNVCDGCFHSQLSVVIDPKMMFEQYLYVSSTSKTFREHCAALAADAVFRAGRENLHVLDIACNDGLLLNCFRNLGCLVQGVDPSVNLRELTVEKGIPVEVDYWSEEVAERIKGDGFDIITATNVFAHVDDVAGFLKACKTALKPKGYVLIEFPYCKDMIGNAEFDTIYHEHLSYFLVNSFSTLTRRCGYEIFDIMQTPIHGSSIRFFIRPGDGKDCQQVSELIKKEDEKGLLSTDIYKSFEARILKTKTSFCDEISEYRKYRKVIGYGASAKGNTMLNFFGVKLDYIVDDNPMKWGYLTPGRDIPICSPDDMAKEKGPLAIVMMSWNFADEIMQNIKRTRPFRGDVCLFYVPETKVVELPAAIPFATLPRFMI